MQKMTLYDHVLMWAMAKRAKHHGLDLKNGMQVETRAVRMMGDADGVHYAEGVDQIPPDIMPQIIEAMGFVPSREQHDPACPKQVDSELKCNCVQPPTVWTAPNRVQVHMGEDYATALAERRASS